MGITINSKKDNWSWYVVLNRQSEFNMKYIRGHLKKHKNNFLHTLQLSIFSTSGGRIYTTLYFP
jgi:hypothetical protein